LKVFFQVPEIDEMKGRDIIKHENTDTDTNIINWQLSSESQTLNSVTESLVKNSNVNNGEDISLSTKD
jgi:hypothetical protein